MKLIRRFVLLLVLFVNVSFAVSQDSVPKILDPQPPLSYNPEQPWVFLYTSPVYIKDIIPPKFAKMGPNIINDKSGSLTPFFEKMGRQLSSGEGVVRVVHIGDSHVRGHFFPGKVKSGMERIMGDATSGSSNGIFDYNTPGISLETGAPGVAYQVFGINGATAQKFCNPESISRIASLKPDLVIISFGTNEGNTRRYNATQHRNQLDMLMRMLKESCPSTTFLLTTPPGAYIRYRGTFSENGNTEKVADVITGYADEHGYAYWDLYDISGGKENACRNWYQNKLMQRDRIHFTKYGYELMGELLFQALIKSYNAYAEH